MTRLPETAQYRTTPRSGMEKDCFVKTLGTPRGKRPAFQPEAFLANSGLGRTILDLKKHQTVFSQGDAANAVFYIQKGRVKLTVISKRGKEATIALLEAGNFLGEECIATIQPQRLVTATAITPVTLLRIKRTEMTRVLHEEQLFSEVFVSYLLAPQRSHPGRPGGSAFQFQ